MREGPAVGLLALLAIAVLTPLTLGGYVASSVDTDAFYGPMVQFLNERLHAGDLPLWLPTAFSGQPFFADPQSGLFYPPTLVANALLDPGDALAAVVAFHYLLGTLGAYAFVRLLRAGRLGAVYAALAFGVGGAMIARSQALGLLGGAAWLPVSLACAQLVALRGGRFGAPARRPRALLHRPRADRLAAADGGDRDRLPDVARDALGLARRARRRRRGGGGGRAGRHRGRAAHGVPLALDGARGRRRSGRPRTLRLR